MIAANARVDHVNVHARPGVVIHVTVVDWQVPLVDAIETPARVRLRGRQDYRAIFLDEGNARVLTHGHRLFFGQLDGEAPEDLVIHVMNPAPEWRRQARSSARQI